MTAPIIPELTSVARVKRYLRMDPTPHRDDGVFQDLVDAANDALTKAIGRNLVSATYLNEVYNGTGTGTLMLANTPVTAVSALSIVTPRFAPNAAQQSTTFILGVDFMFTPYAIKLFRRMFCRGVGNVQVSYTGGYAEIPADVFLAATKWAALRYREVERLGQRSKTMGQETVSYDLADMPPDVLQTVERYKQKIPVIPQLAGTV